MKGLILSGVQTLELSEMKSIKGGDGFECANDYNRCDAAHPTNFRDFNECMFWAGCLGDA